MKRKMGQVKKMNRMIMKLDNGGEKTKKNA